MEGERTDNQIFDREPVEKPLGDRVFVLRPQANSKGRRFRKNHEEIQERIVATNSIAATDEMIDLVYEYDASLADEREWISDHATDDQLVEVFAVIYGFAVGPFVDRLPRALAKAQGIDEATMQRLIGEVEKGRFSKPQCESGPESASEK